VAAQASTRGLSPGRDGGRGLEPAEPARRQPLQRRRHRLPQQPVVQHRRRPHLQRDGTVKSTGIPNAYTTSLTASGGAASGYVLPSSFTLTLPGDFTLNDSLVGRELTAAQEASPVAADAIGTFSLVSPASEGFGLSSTDTVTGSIYVVDVPKDTDPSLELYLKSGVFMLGTFPTSLAFPLTLTFDGINASALGLSSTEAIPLQSVALTFPATTSPVEATSCSNLGTVTGTATDEVAALAASLSADTTDGYAASGNAAVAIPGTPTVVTDECAAAGSKGTLSVSKKTKKGTLSLKVAATAAPSSSQSRSSSRARH